MHIYLANIFGNPNVGLYCFCSDSYCLVPLGLPEKFHKKIEETLKVPVIETSIAGTTLLGVFFAGNSNCLLVPEIAFKEDLKVLDDNKIKYHIVESRYTALGNNILCNDNGCIINPNYTDKTLSKIESALGVPTKRGTINKLDIVGSLASVNNTNGVCGNDIEDYEKKFIKNILKIDMTTGTVNFGSAYIGSGVIVNSHGFVIGDMSSGVEVANIDETFVGEKDE